MSEKIDKLTPLMKQYMELKNSYPDSVLLYRMGDFYECFNEDAKLVAKVLGIALTKRGGEDAVPLAGFPYHALDAHLPKLLRAGFKVARCEQVEDPKTAKGIVKREIVEIVSAGSTFSDKVLDHRFNNYIASLIINKETIGFAYADVSTGEFVLCEIEEKQLIETILSINPRELLISNNQREQIKSQLSSHFQGLYSNTEPWFFDYTYSYEQLLRHFNTHSLKGFGCQDMPMAISAAGALFNYLKNNYKDELNHITQLNANPFTDVMMLDISTKKNLEIYQTIQENESQKATLISVLDQCLTPMGSRLMRKWVNQPLINKDPIEKRHIKVEALIKNQPELDQIRLILKEIGDMERILARVATGRCSPRDVAYLKIGLKNIQPANNILILLSDAWDIFVKQFNDLSSIITLIENAVVENPPILITEGNIFKTGFNPDLDELQMLSKDGKNVILDMQVKERDRTGIPSLKISFTSVFGYYIEITNTHKDKVPNDYIRKQTLVNAERYITPELKMYEEKVLHADERLAKLEYELFQNLRLEIVKKIKEIQINAHLIAEIDCLCSFAFSAIKQNYTRPNLRNDGIFSYSKGRHPVVEQLLATGNTFIDNDCYLDLEKQQIMIITGPNMAGKSTYLRQTGLIILLAQIGSFVPAEKAEISICDRIFTRVGASDNLAAGESTFLVEMNEAANILNNATDRSLILLDELGRGTSTFDGLSIAWSVVEYLHNTKKCAAKTLFATHYHELTELELLYPRIKNFNIAVEEYNDQIIFLRKIIKGGSDHSYGIQVAQMAGLPPSVIERAKEILSNLEENELNPNTAKPKLAKRQKNRYSDESQLLLFNVPEIKKDSLLEQQLKALSIDNLTPLEALLKLHELKKLI